MDVRPVTVAFLREHGAEVIAEHDRELRRFPAHVKLDVSWDRLQQVEDAGLVIAFGAFDGDSLVGYALSYAYRHMHYDVLLAANDALFVLPAYRAKGLGLRLVRETERIAASMGAREVTWQARRGSTLERLLRKMDYRDTSSVMVKGVGR